MVNDRVAGQQSVRRAVEVLFCFDVDTPSLSASEVADRLALNRTTAWRYLQTLAGTGLVQEVGEGRFGLGARTLSLASAYASQWGELEAVAGTALLRLRDRVGETAALHLRQGWHRVVVRQVESRLELRRTYRDLGAPISLLAGAPSRAILAELPLHEREVVLAEASERGSESGSERGRERLAEKLAQELARVRADGFAVSRGGRVPNVASVAAAVRDPRGRVLGAVNVTGPEERLPASEVPGVARQVVDAARWIERQLAQPATPLAAGAPRGGDAG